MLLDHQAVLSEYLAVNFLIFAGGCHVLDSDRHSAGHLIKIYRVNIASLGSLSTERVKDEKMIFPASECAGCSVIKSAEGFVGAVVHGLVKIPF